VKSEDRNSHMVLSTLPHHFPPLIFLGKNLY
jgi:hypothetical protein